MRGSVMLPRTTDPTPRRCRLLMGALLVGAVLVAAGPRARAQDEGTRTETALSLIPADAAFFSTSLRLKEQVDLFLQSNAYKTLRSLPAVKTAVEKAKTDLDKAGGLGMYKKFMEDKENQDLVNLLKEAVSQEVFIYGGKGWTDFISLAMRVNNAQSWA